MNINDKNKCCNKSCQCHDLERERGEWNKTEDKLNLLAVGLIILMLAGLVIWILLSKTN